MIQVSDTVEQWGLFSVELEGPADDSMYLDESLSGTFSCRNREVGVRGFYDGDVTTF